MSKTLFCRVACSPFRSEAKDSSEMVSQVLFGELVTLVQKTEKWILIKSLEDGYEGFADPKQYIEITETEKDNWLALRKRYFSFITLKTSRGFLTLPPGCFSAPYFSLQEQHYEITDEQKEFPDWQAFSNSFLNVSYLWGGRSHYGIDCSGFTQQIMRFRGTELPRDASQQVLYGNTVAFEQRIAGDIAFFHNTNNKITHVGILTEKDRIIHASGFVKEDTFTQEGIICSETKQLTHSLNCIKNFPTR